MSRRKKKNKSMNYVIFILIIILLIFIFISKLNILTSKSTNDFNPNDVPYISTYYIKPIVSTDEEVIIDYYITDYYHKEYINDDYSDTFTVIVKIDGKEDIVSKNLKAGDHSISLGKFDTLGEQNFSIICTDQYGRNSHELFNYFLVRNDVPTNEYIMTESDLTNYKIDNTDNKDNSTQTRLGIQYLLDDKKTQGYNKLTLLPGTYRIDHMSPIYIPTEFTLDLNQSTIKLNGFAGDKALMIELNNTFDSHVTNGTIEGDFYEHDYENSPNDSEWVNGIKIGGESKYSSFENLVIKDITGYGGTNGLSESRDNTLEYTYIYPTKIGDSFKLGDIDRNTGEDIDSNDRTTSDFIDVSEYAEIGYLSVSRYLGYQGNPYGTWNLIVHFYDENEQFIQSTDAYQYRRIRVPSNTKYMKVTILNEDYPDDLSVQLFRVPTHCSFKDIKFENCRAVGLAQEAMKDMLVENCEFTNSGQELAGCAYDAEDGWDLMQDVTFRGLNFYNNPNSDFLTCAGHNFIVEDSNMDIYIWGRTRNVVIRNNTLKGTRIHNDGLVRSGVPKVISNKVTDTLTFANSDEATYYSLVKECDFTSPLLNAVANNCTFDIPSGYLHDVTINNSIIKNIGTEIDNNVNFNNSLFYSDTISYLKFNELDGNRAFSNCTFEGKTELIGNYFNKAIFNNCKFEDVSISVNAPNKSNDLQFNNCNISYSSYNLLTISDDTNVIFNNCDIISSLNDDVSSSIVYLDSEPSKGSSVFKDCNIIKSNGYVLDGYYDPGYINKNYKYKVKLENSVIKIQYLSEKYKNSKRYTIDIIN